jgi:hypothetical protein
MHQETPTATFEGQPLFDRDGNFNAAQAIDLALEKRALGEIDSADALDLLIDFFITSQNYIFNGISASDHEFSPAERNQISPAQPS